MAVHAICKNKGIYFITFTCHCWLPLIERSDGYDAVYNFFRVLKTNGHSLCGYVIMPNHIHMLLYYSGQGKNLNLAIGNGKRFMAYEMLKNLQRKNHHDLLNILEKDVQSKARQKGQRHCFWKDSFEVKECRTEKFLLQKLHYLHNNPVSGKWKLAASSLEYVHSSAPFYLNGRQQLCEVKDYEELLDWEHMYE
jgi:REP element-mobilizing transposase RayT